MIIQFQHPCHGQGCQAVVQAAQSHIHLGLECLQGLGIHRSLSNLFLCVTTIWVKNFLLVSNLNLPCPSLKPFPLVLSPSTLVNSHSPSCLYVPFKYWKAAMRSRSLLFSKLNKPSSLNPPEFFLVIRRYYCVLLIIVDQFYGFLLRIHCNRSHGQSSKNVQDKHC